MSAQVKESARKFWLILIISGVAGLLFVAWRENRHTSSIPLQSVPPEILTRLKNLDKSFHNFVALANKRTEAAYEEGDDSELPVETPVEIAIQETIIQVDNPRWKINDSFYSKFLKMHQVKKKVSQKCSGKYRMLILVQSYITHRERRDSIRRSWGNSTSQSAEYNWKTLFIIGRTPDKKHPQMLADEMRVHNDLLLFHTGESFYNLTEKLQKSFQWIDKHCDFKYLLKCDDDIFVNVANLYDYLDQPKIPSENLFAGQVMWWSEVYRSGRYAIDKGYKRDVYPRYCSGGGFVLSRDVVHRFVQLFPHVPYMRIDDAYFGELALKAGLGILHNDQFRMWTSNCDWTERSIIIHPVKNEKCMKEMYKKSFITFAGIGV